VSFYEPLRPLAGRLGRLLSDQRGTEILAELEKLRLRDPATGPSTAGEEPTATGPEDGHAIVGVWQAEPGDDGVALRRREDVPGSVLADWADVGYVPGAGGAQRVVLLGESAARGWPLDPGFNPATALRRNLAAAEPGGYQCVDLAKTGATAADLVALAGQIPLARPDVVVAFAGNNWSLPLDEGELRMSSPGQTGVADLLARALRRGGYAAMRRAFVSDIVLRRAEAFCAGLAALQAGGARVIVVIPEFNLRAWRLPADAGVPMLPAADLRQWHDLSARLGRACDLRHRAEAEHLAAKMRTLDGGTSAVPGQLLGRLAESLGDGTAARAELEDSRDAICGLFVRHTPRIMSEVQQMLASFAAGRGLGVVDLRRVLASADLPDLPGEDCFHDYCHLSDVGIERAMAAVADAIRGVRPGTTEPGPGAGSQLQAFAHAHAAVHLAYQGQPAPVVASRLRAAVGTDAGLRPIMAGVLELLSCPRPAWIQPSAAELADVGDIAAFVIPLAAARALSADQWTLRECLAELTASGAFGVAPQTDLLAPPDARGHAPANWTRESSFHRATAQRSFLAFALDRPRGGTLDLTYRMAAGPRGGSAVVSCNGTRLAELPARRRWATGHVTLPSRAARSGVNWVSFTWPVPEDDAGAGRDADAAALARGEFPDVLPVFGEIFHGLLTLAG
jgi:hypothetical protein